MGNIYVHLVVLQQFPYNLILPDVPDSVPCSRKRDLDLCNLVTAPKI